MFRFEEFAVQPIPTAATTAKTLPLPLDCASRPDAAAMDAFLAAPLWPAPSRQANVALPNQWSSKFVECLGLTNIVGVIEGRPPGEDFAHQRWDEFPPQVFFQTSTGGARMNNGVRDNEQKHSYAVGEFGPPVAGQEGETGLYHNTAGAVDTIGTTNNIEVRFHPSMPIQDENSVWGFDDGTFPPKLLPVRYAQPVLLRHYNVLPMDIAANNGFGEHTLTTHEHNGHNPGESDGFAGAFFFPGQYYDYRWPMQLAGYDSINTDASDPRASTPCSPGETIMVSIPGSGNSGGGDPESVLCDPDTLTVNIPGDWHEIMSTHWFHDHMADRTAENVYKGDVAMMNYYSGIDRGKEGFRCEYDDPATNVNLCFPSGTALDWGNRDYDVQLLLTAKAWAPVTGQLAMAPLNNNGFLGDRMTVNWLYKPYMDVRARQYRFRMLDGSVSRFFKMAFVQEFNDATTGDFAGPAGSNKSYSRIPYHMIANDGNIMEHAVAFPNAQSKDMPVLGVAERHDIIIDFSQFPVGANIYMVNTLEHDDGKGPKDVIPLADILNETYKPVVVTDADCPEGCWQGGDPVVGKVMEFRVQPYSGTDLSMNPADYEVGKKMMIPLVNFSDAELAAATHRTFTFGRGGGEATDGRPVPWTIETDNSGVKLNTDLNVVSAAPETMFGGVEIWHLVNGGGGWAHPIHIHFEEGQILLRGNEIEDADGNDTGVIDYTLPPLWEIGARKDVYRVSGMGGPGGLPDSSMIIDVAIRFREFAGTFMEHCHNTTHEDNAMLLRWDNENPGQTVRIATPIPEWGGVKYVSVDNPWQVPDGSGAEATEVATLATFKTGDTGTAGSFIVPNQILGDLDLDGTVGFSDFSLFRGQFGQPGLWGGDLNESRQVGFDDFSLFRANFGKTAGFPLPPNDPTP